MYMKKMCIFVHEDLNPHLFGLVFVSSAFSVLFKLQARVQHQ